MQGWRKCGCDLLMKAMCGKSPTRFHVVLHEAGTQLTGRLQRFHGAILIPSSILARFAYTKFNNLLLFWVLWSSKSKDQHPHASAAPWLGTCRHAIAPHTLAAHEQIRLEDTARISTFCNVSANVSKTQLHPSFILDSLAELLQNTNWYENAS